MRTERARVLGWLHRPEEALRDYDHVLAVTPRDADAALARARVLLRAWIGSTRPSAPSGARLPTTRASPTPTLALGGILLRRGQVADATAAFTRARELAPDDAAPLLGLARARAAAGDAAGATAARTQALAVLDRHLARDPSDRDARVARAQVLAALGRDAEALAEYDRVLEHVAPRRGGRARPGAPPGAARPPRRRGRRRPPGGRARSQVGRRVGGARRRADAPAAARRGHARVRGGADPRPPRRRARARTRPDPPAPGGPGRSARGVRGSAPARPAQPGRRRRPGPDRPRRAGPARPAGSASISPGRYEALDGRSDWMQETVVLGVRPRPGTSFFVGLDQYHRNDRDDTQLSIGAGQALPWNFTLAGSFAYGIDAEVIAQEIYEVEVTRPLAPWITPSLRFRWSDFVGDTYAASLAPGIELTWQSYLAVLRDTTSRTRRTPGTGMPARSACLLFPEDQWSVYGSVAYGRETYLADTVEDGGARPRRPDPRRRASSGASATTSGSGSTTSTRTGGARTRSMASESASSSTSSRDAPGAGLLARPGRRGCHDRHHRRPLRADDRPAGARLAA